MRAWLAEKRVRPDLRQIGLQEKQVAKCRVRCWRVRREVIQRLFVKQPIEPSDESRRGINDDKEHDGNGCADGDEFPSLLLQDERLRNVVHASAFFDTADS